MKIGEQVYHNPVFLVAPPDREVDSVFTTGVTAKFLILPFRNLE
jgi:hypothetical protein